MDRLAARTYSTTKKITLLVNPFFPKRYHMVPPSLPINNKYNKFLAQNSCTKLVQNMFIARTEHFAHVFVSFKVSVAQIAKQCG